MRPIILAAVLAISSVVNAEHRVVLVLPPDAADDAGAALDLETRIGHSADVSLISRGSQLDVLDFLKKRATSSAPMLKDDALALQLGRLTGADGVVLGTPGAWRLCKLPASTCAAITGDGPAAADAALSSLGAAPVPPHDQPWPDEAKNAAAKNAYAACRTRVLVAVEQAAVKGHKTQLKRLDSDCKKALAADPDFIPAQAALAAAHAIQGEDSSEKALRDALVTMPTDPLPAEALIHFLVEKDRAQDALDALAAAEANAKNSIDLRRLRGERLYAMDMFKDSLPAFQSALDLAPRSPYLHWRLSAVMHGQQDNVTALTHAQAASELSGGIHPFYQEEYASRLIDNNKYDEAKAILDVLRKNDPDWGRVALRLGYVLHKQGKYADAIPLLKQAVTAKPRGHHEVEDVGLAILDLARAYAKLGDADGAFAQLNNLKARHEVDAFQLKEPDFDSLRQDPRFAELLAD